MMRSFFALLLFAALVSPSARAMVACDETALLPKVEFDYDRLETDDWKAVRVDERTLEFTPKKPHDLAFFEGVLHLMLQLYPHLEQRYGMSFREGKMRVPTLEALNAILENDPLFNGLRFDLISGDQLATEQELAARFAEGKILLANHGQLFFHDIGVHGLGYILLPKALIDYMRQQAHLALAVRRIPGLEKLGNAYAEAIAMNVDGASDNILRTGFLMNNMKNVHDRLTFLMIDGQASVSYGGRYFKIHELQNDLQRVLEQPEGKYHSVDPSDFPKIRTALERYSKLPKPAEVDESMILEMQEKLGPRSWPTEIKPSSAHPLLVP